MKKSSLRHEHHLCQSADKMGKLKEGGNYTVIANVRNIHPTNITVPNDQHIEFQIHQVSPPRNPQARPPNKKKQSSLRSIISCIVSYSVCKHIFPAWHISLFTVFPLLIFIRGAYSYCFKIAYIFLLRYLICGAYSYCFKIAYSFSSYINLTRSIYFSAQHIFSASVTLWKHYRFHK